MFTLYQSEDKDFFCRLEDKDHLLKKLHLPVRQVLPQTG